MELKMKYIKSYESYEPNTHDWIVYETNDSTYEYGIILKINDKLGNYSVINSKNEPWFIPKSKVVFFSENEKDCQQYLELEKNEENIGENFSYKKRKSGKKWGKMS